MRVILGGPDRTPGQDRSEPPRIRLVGITKRYGALLANDGIDLTIARGEIHAIVGENGAGKTTLMRILYGMVRPDAGTIEIDGAPTDIADPAMAIQLGSAWSTSGSSLSTS